MFGFCKKKNSQKSTQPLS